MRENAQVYSQMSLADSGAFWRSGSSRATTIPADGCVDLILLDDELWLAGPSTQRVNARADGAAMTYGLRFAPGTVARSLHLDLAELRDSRVALRDLLGSRKAASVDPALRQLARDYDAGRPLTTPPNLVESRDGWVQLIQGAARSRNSLAEVVSQLDWSERHVYRRMIVTFGYGYPTLLRIERARYASELIARGRDLSATASAVGYADQSHMTREFARFIGHTPGQLALSSA